MADLKLNLALDIKAVLAGTADVSRAVKSFFEGAKKEGDQLFDGAKQSATAFAAQFESLNAGISNFAGKIASVFTQAGDIAAQKAGIGKRFKAEFGESSDAVEQFSNSLAKSIAQDNDDVQKFLTQINFVTKNMGFARDKGIELSKTIVELGFDLAAARGIQAADAMGVLQQALVGNVRALKTYGIAISDTAEAEEALKQGFNPDSLTKQQESTVRLAIVTNALAEAKGTAAKSAGGMGAALRTLKNESEELLAELGKVYNEAIAPLVKGAASAVKTIHEWVDANPVLSKTILGVATGAGLAVISFAALVQGIVSVITFSKQATIALEATKVAMAGIAPAAKATGAAMATALGPIAIAAALTAAIVEGALALFGINAKLKQNEAEDAAFQKQQQEGIKAFAADRVRQFQEYEQAAERHEAALKKLQEAEEAFAKSIKESQEELFKTKFGELESGVLALRETFRARKAGVVESGDAEVRQLFELQDKLAAAQKTKSSNSNEYARLEAELRGHTAALKWIND